jgi:NADH:ubiquinone oxidoreductase subunit K
MQLQGLMLILLLFLIIPIITVFANHNVFFIVISFSLLINAINSTLSLFLKASGEAEESVDGVSVEIIEELEEMTNIDIKKFDTGITVSKNLIVILFLFYCSVFVYTTILKAIIAFLVVISIRNIIQRLILKSDLSLQKSTQNFKQKMIILTSNIGAMILIVFVIINKFTGI